MTQLVQAIFENGVFRPIGRIDLSERERVSLVVESIAPDGDALVRQQAALAALRAEMDALPQESPSDGLGGADHDQILYGGTT